MPLPLLLSFTSEQNRLINKAVNLLDYLELNTDDAVVRLRVCAATWAPEDNKSSSILEFLSYLELYKDGGHVMSLRCVVTPLKALYLVRLPSTTIASHLLLLRYFSDTLYMLQLCIDLLRLGQVVQSYLDP